ncbi:serine protease, partial [Streptomyces sp. SID10692]|nr:serine protease [Streptomyces sp. SID10692]
MTDVSVTGAESAAATTGAIQQLAECWIREGMAAAPDRGESGGGAGRSTPGFVCSPAGLWLALAA